IHAKLVNGTTNPMSASKMHDVVSEVVKNLSYLSPFNKLAPSKVKSWSKTWHKTQINRIIKPCETKKSAQNIWDALQKKIKDPDTSKEVWIFTKGIISKRHFLKTINNKNLTEHHVALQIKYLIQSTASLAYSHGA